MQVEKLRPYYLSPIERELYFSKWANINNIKQILFDFDDTICVTGQIFQTQREKAIDFTASSYPLFTPKQWKNIFEKMNDESYEKHSVNPNRFNIIADTLCNRFNLNELTRQTIKNIFQEVYRTPITFTDGAQNTLKFLKKVEIPIGIVTHANQEWTYQKYQWLDLERFLDWDDVYIVNENDHKTSESWSDALKYFHRQPQNCLIIGDSPRSDINPARNIGVKHCFLIQNQPTWSIHQQPIDSEIRIIEKISDLIKIGCGQL